MRFSICSSNLGPMTKRSISPCSMPAAGQAPRRGRLEKPGTDIIPVFEALLKHVPAPHGDPEKSLQIQITSIHYNDYVGRIGVGRIYNGRIKTGQQVSVVKRDGTHRSRAKSQQVQAFDGLGRKDVETAEAGDIVALIGLESVDISDSICDSDRSAAAGSFRTSSRRR